MQFQASQACDGGESIAGRFAFDIRGNLTHRAKCDDAQWSDDGSALPRLATEFDGAIPACEDGHVDVADRLVVGCATAARRPGTVAAALAEPRFECSGSFRAGRRRAARIGVRGPRMARGGDGWARASRPQTSIGFFRWRRRKGPRPRAREMGWAWRSARASLKFTGDRCGWKIDWSVPACGS